MQLLLHGCPNAPLGETISCPCTCLFSVYAICLELSSLPVAEGTWHWGQCAMQWMCHASTTWHVRAHWWTIRWGARVCFTIVCVCLKDDACALYYIVQFQEQLPFGRRQKSEHYSNSPSTFGKIVCFMRLWNISDIRLSCHFLLAGFLFRYSFRFRHVLVWLYDSIVKARSAALIQGHLTGEQLLWRQLPAGQVVDMDSYGVWQSTGENNSRSLAVVFGSSIHACSVVRNSQESMNLRCKCMLW